MLKAALTARLPLITCETSDTLNASRIVQHLSGYVPRLIRSRKDYTGPSSQVLIAFGEVEDFNEADIIKTLRPKAQVLVMVNPSESLPLAFKAGVMPVPSKLVHSLLIKDFEVDKGNVSELKTALGGLTLREVDDVCCLAMAEHQELTGRAVRSVRLQASQVVPGVQAVNTNLPFYYPHAGLELWVTNVAPFLLRTDLDFRLRPRGLLMHGSPGTGKTLGSKFIASALGVPLFRLDLGQLMSKYVGESEKNQRRALQVISQNEPCVLLLDEVEKLFQGNEDSGVTQNLLAEQLWWLQEHQMRVLTIMTTNDRDALPTELVRPGRIDQTIEFGPVDDVQAFCVELVGSLGISKIKGLGALKQKDWAKGMGTCTHAHLTTKVIDVVRERLRAQA